jgi:importin subunit beta-1
MLQLTHQAIQKDEADVKLRAIEFWSTVAETEADVMDEIKDCQEIGKTPKRQLHNFVNKALQHLAPLLLECLTKQVCFSRKMFYWPDPLSDHL